MNEDELSDVLDGIPINNTLQPVKDAPGWFTHRDYPKVFCKVGATKKGRWICTWVRFSKTETIVLAARPLTPDEVAFVKGLN